MQVFSFPIRHGMRARSFHLQTPELSQPEGTQGCRLLGVSLPSEFSVGNHLSPINLGLPQWKTMSLIRLKIVSPPSDWELPESGTMSPPSDWGLSKSEIMPPPSDWELPESGTMSIPTDWELPESGPCLLHQTGTLSPPSG